MAVGQNQWHHFGVGVPPILEPILVGIGMFNVHWGYGSLTHGQMGGFPWHSLDNPKRLPLTKRHASSNGYDNSEKDTLTVEMNPHVN